MLTGIVLFYAIFTVNVHAFAVEKFIVGGEGAIIEDFPHAAFLSINCARRATICGGSILNEILILTAAHCLHKCDNDDKIIVSIGSKAKIGGATVQNTVPELRSKAKFGLRVKIIILMKHPPFAKTGHVSGWGLTNVSYGN